MGVILVILILALLLTDVKGIVSYLSHFIHVKQSSWLVLRVTVNILLLPLL